MPESYLISVSGLYFMNTEGFFSLMVVEDVLNASFSFALLPGKLRVQCVLPLDQVP